MSSSQLRAVLRASTLMVCASQTMGFAQNIEGTEDLGILILGESKREVQTETAESQTILDQDEIDDRQAGTIAELIDSVPGVTLVNGSTPQGSGISIRGYGANSTFGTDQKVVIFQDGSTQGQQEVYRIGTQLFSEPELFNEVEVLRGPVGTFEYTSGAVRGLVNLTTKNASDFTLGERQFAARQTLRYSSNGDGLLSSTILAWQPTEQFEVLLNYIYREQSEQDDGNGNTIGNSAFELPSYFAKARLSFGNDNNQSLSVIYNQTTASDRDVPYDTFLTAGDTFGNVDRDTESRTLVLEYTYEPLDNDLVNLSVNLSHAEADIQQAYVPGSSVCENPAVAPTLPFCTGFPIGVGFGVVNADLNYTTTKLTAKTESFFATGGITHDLTFGAEIIQIERAEADSAPGGTDRRFALFAVNEMNFGGGWTFTPALRYETSNIKDATDGTEYDNDALMGQLSLRYAFNNGFAVFGNVAYTESLPILDDLRNAFTGLPQPDLMTTSEKATIYELGFSYAGQDVFAAGDDLGLKAVFYASNLSDVTSFSGVAEVDQRGLEFEASYAMRNGFYTDLNFNIVDGDETLASGMRQQYRFLPSDDVQLTIGKRLGDAWDLSWEVVARASIDDPVTAANSRPGYSLHNVRATYKPQRGVLEGTEIRLGIENLFDKQITPRRSTRPRPGRNIILTVARTF
jgi:hemoglobin/transferrin/lactoferrin receptor protein